MVISNRTKDIVKILLDSREYIKVEDISNRLGISERTVYRLIPKITDILWKYQIELMTVSKKGMKLKGDTGDVLRCREEICGRGKLQMTDRGERFFIVLMELLSQSDYIKTEALSINLGVSLSTIRNDLKEFEGKFPGVNIKIKSKKGAGIYLEGSAFSKDYLFIYCLLQNVDVEVIIQWMSHELNVYNLFLQKFSEKYNIDYVRVCHILLRDYIYVDAQEYDFQIDDYNYVEIVLLLAVYAQRYKEGYTEYFPIIQLEKDPELTRFVNDWCDSFADEFRIMISSNDLRYIQYIWKRRINKLEFHNWDTVFGQDVHKEIFKFIAMIENKMGIDMRQDTKLMDGLIMHVDKALERARSGMSISNPFVQETKKNYAQMFQTVKTVLAQVFPKDFFSDDEVAYVVLYFVATLDRISQRSFQVMVVCSGGMGSSKMLASRLEREIPEIHVKKITSIIGMRQEDPADYDLILSTIPLIVNNVEFLRVSPLLPEDDIELVRSKIRRHKYKVLKKIDRERAVRRGNDFQSLKNMQEMTDWGLNIIQNFHIFEMNVFMEAEDILYNQKVILEQIGVFIPTQELMDYRATKGNISYFVISDTKICYYECCTKSITYPILFLERYKEEQRFGNGEQFINSAICFYYPMELSKSQRDLLKYLIDLLIGDKEVQHYIDCKEESEIWEILSNRLRKYIFDYFK